MLSPKALAFPCGFIVAAALDRVITSMRRLSLSRLGVRLATCLGVKPSHAAPQGRSPPERCAARPPRSAAPRVRAARTSPSRRRNRVQIPPRRWPLPDRKHGRFCTFGAPESLARTWAKSASSLLPAGKSPLPSCAVIESTFRFFHFRTPIDELRERLEPVTKAKETFLRNGISLILREGWEQRLRHEFGSSPLDDHSI